ncbi:hypothetical protein glysoja_037627 [Glycine soja]|uniref:Uncharacterized protein n=1 Tax=Glycine soja TaxID=3848 RepID=A0A0B2P4L8_GLYSO|nr:hypothetical protein glysoja_037627 [Glycine soja]
MQHKQAVEPRKTVRLNQGVGWRSMAQNREPSFSFMFFYLRNCFIGF